MEGWLNDTIRETVAITQHGKHNRNRILDSDVLSAVIGHVDRVKTKIPCGTGRLAAVAGNWAGSYGGLTSPFAQLAADFSSEVTRKVTNKLYNNLPDANSASAAAVEEKEAEEEEKEQGFDKRVSQAWRNHPAARFDEPEGQASSANNGAGDGLRARDCDIGFGCHPSGVPFQNQDEIKSHLLRPWEDSLAYIQRMEFHTGPVLPFQLFAQLVAKIAHEHVSGLTFCPSAVQVLQAMLEDYMHHLLVEAHLIVLREGCQRKTFPFHGYDVAHDPDGELRSLAINPNHFELARRIRGERA